MVRFVACSTDKVRMANPCSYGHRCGTCTLCRIERKETPRTFTQELCDLALDPRADAFARKMAMRLLAMKNGAAWDDTPFDRGI